MASIPGQRISSWVMKHLTRLLKVCQYAAHLPQERKYALLKFELGESRVDVEVVEHIGLLI